MRYENAKALLHKVLTATFQVGWTPKKEPTKVYGTVEGINLLDTKKQYFEIKIGEQWFPGSFLTVHYNANTRRSR